MKKPVLTYMPKGMVLTDPEFDMLHKRLNSTRSTSKSVTVPMEALRHILADHSRLYGRIEDLDRHLRAGNGSKLEEPPRPLFDDAPDIPQRPRRQRVGSLRPAGGHSAEAWPVEDDDEDLIG